MTVKELIKILKSAPNPYVEVFLNSSNDSLEDVRFYPQSHLNESMCLLFGSEYEGEEK